jgi:hypothetical protein
MFAATLSRLISLIEWGIANSADLSVSRVGATCADLSNMEYLAHVTVKCLISSRGFALLVIILKLG